MKNPKLILTTRFHENRPVEIAGVGLWSKRLNGEEEMLLQEMNLRGISKNSVDKLRGEVELLRHVVQHRVRDQRFIDVEWVEQHLGQVTGDRLISYLRTGQGLNPGETFDLPVFEPIELEGRTFTSRALSYAEVLTAAAKSDEMGALSIADDAARMGEDMAPGENETADEMLERVGREAMALHERSVAVSRATADLVAETLNARIADGGEPVTGSWLLSLLRQEDLQAITTYLRDRSVAPDAEEEETPNADEDAPASG